MQTLMFPIAVALFVLSTSAMLFSYNALGHMLFLLGILASAAKGFLDMRGEHEPDWRRSFLQQFILCCAAVPSFTATWFAH